MSEREIRVAIAGFGTVGQAVIQLLREEASRYREEIGVPLRLAAVLDRSIRRKDTRLLDSSVVMTDSLDQFFQTPADIVVELIGGHEPADSIITAGLQQGKAVVTANKLLLAQHARRYFQLARDHNAYLGFEAAVAGGIPILRVLRRALFADRIVRLRGILNGTCNFILSEMSQSGRDFQDVLKEAQARGYAEADPWLDISGRDTTDKLSILSLLAFGKTSQPEKIPTLGIQAISFVDFLYANKLDYTIKLLGVAQRNGDEITLRVSPFLTHRRLPLAAIGGALNAVEVTGNKLGSAMFTGRGAGGDPTAVSVVADILNAALWKQEAAPFYLQPVFHRDSTESPDTADPAATGSTEVYPFFLRFFVKDRTGIIAEVASILARHQININSLWQEPWSDLSNLPFVITIEPTLFSTMQRALAELSQLEFNRVPPLALPMLNE